jgi:hypothetical protein
MKHLGTKPLGLALVMAALVLSVSSRAYGYWISVYPDSVVTTAAVGNSTDAYVYISDGRDTSQSLPLGTVHVYLTGSSQFTMMTDSILQFAGETYIRLRYTPTDLYTATGQLRTVGDSNTQGTMTVSCPIRNCVRILVLITRMPTPCG